LRKSIELTDIKKESISWYHLGCLFFEQGDYTKAETSLLNFTGNRFQQYWNLLGKVLKYLGKYDGARKAFQRAREEP
ncbi:MAG: tetratricopeptide repeat protein, partial [Candidatus Thorarchaeota archaeon]